MEEKIEEAKANQALVPYEGRAYGGGPTSMSLTQYGIFHNQQPQMNNWERERMSLTIANNALNKCDNLADNAMNKCENAMNKCENAMNSAQEISAKALDKMDKLASIIASTSKEDREERDRERQAKEDALRQVEEMKINKAVSEKENDIKNLLENKTKEIIDTTKKVGEDIKTSLTPHKAPATTANAGTPQGKSSVTRTLFTVEEEGVHEDGVPRTVIKENTGSGISPLRNDAKPSANLSTNGKQVYIDILIPKVKSFILKPHAIARFCHVESLRKLLQDKTKGISSETLRYSAKTGKIVTDEELNTFQVKPEDDIRVEYVFKRENGEDLSEKDINIDIFNWSVASDGKVVNENETLIIPPLYQVGASQAAKTIIAWLQNPDFEHPPPPQICISDKKEAQILIYFSYEKRMATASSSSSSSSSGSDESVESAFGCPKKKEQAGNLQLLNQVGPAMGLNYKNIFNGELLTEIDFDLTVLSKEMITAGPFFEEFLQLLHEVEITDLVCVTAANGTSGSCALPFSVSRLHSLQTHASLKRLEFQRATIDKYPMLNLKYCGFELCFNNCEIDLGAEFLHYDIDQEHILPANANSPLLKIEIKQHQNLTVRLISDLVKAVNKKRIGRIFLNDCAADCAGRSDLLDALGQLFYAMYQLSDALSRCSESKVKAIDDVFKFSNLQLYDVKEGNSSKLVAMKDPKICGVLFYTYLLQLANEKRVEDASKAYQYAEKKSYLISTEKALGKQHKQELARVFFPLLNNNKIAIEEQFPGLEKLVSTGCEQPKKSTSYEATKPSASIEDPNKNIMTLKATSIMTSGNNSCCEPPSSAMNKSVGCKRTLEPSMDLKSSRFKAAPESLEVPIDNNGVKGDTNVSEKFRGGDTMKEAYEAQKKDAVSDGEMAKLDNKATTNIPMAEAEKENFVLMSKDALPKYVTCNNGRKVDLNAAFNVPGIRSLDDGRIAVPIPFAKTTGGPCGNCRRYLTPNGNNKSRYCNRHNKDAKDLVFNTEA